MTERVDPPREVVKCGVCTNQMKCIGKLPEIQAKRAVRVFRCYGCNNVTSEPWEGRAGAGLKATEE